MIENYYSFLILSKATTIIDAYGIETSSFIDSNIQGIINLAGSKEIELAKSRGLDIDYKAYVEVTPVSLAIKKDDLINGLRVVSAPKNTLQRNHHLKILLKGSEGNG